MKSIQVLAATAALASAKTIRIDSGPMLDFKPNNIMAEMGDMLEFHFYSRNHSVAQGDFDSACMPSKMGGFFSGYVPVQGTAESDMVFSVMVNDTKPIWFYCTQRQHCKGGMVGVVNPPMGKTLDDYKTAAAATDGSSHSAAMAFGGMLTNGGMGMPMSGTPSSNMPNSGPAVRVAGASVLAAALSLAWFGMM